MAHEEVKANKQVVRTTKQFKLFQLQELNAGKEKLKGKAIKRKQVYENYKRKMELVRKLDVLTDIKIIPNTKQLKLWSY